MAFFSKASDNAAQLRALSKSQAIMEFEMDGTVIAANENFQRLFGYRLDEITGRHHSLFVDPTDRDGDGYRQFWAALNRGEFQSAQYKRIGKDGKEVWIQASYNPILGKGGRPYKVVKYATDVSAQKQTYIDLLGKVQALSRAHGIIELQLDGTVITANENFLSLFGYRLEDIRGKHHSLFVDPADRDNDSYQQFWAALNRGEFQSARYKRIAKGGREVWIEGSYNPIFDLNGRPWKIVKIVTDVTKQTLEDIRTAISRARLEVAIDTSTSNVMIADANFDIIYVNKAVSNFLKEAEQDIQKELPRFRVDGLIGSNIDVFHKNPEHQRAMLGRLSSRYETAILVGGRSFNLVANPVFDANGGRLGTVVEWLDGAAAGQVEAINKSQIVVEYFMDGTIAKANQNFLSLMGYGPNEIIGKHHSLFVDPVEKNSLAYQEFWDGLSRGQAQTSEFKRVAKNGREIWLHATYSPILDLRGKVVRVVQTAVDLSPRKEQNMTLASDFEVGVKSLVNTLAIAATDMRATAQSLSSTAEQTKSQSSTVLVTSEQLASSISEIARQLTKAIEAVGNAVTKADRSQAMVDELVDAATKIGDVTKIIADIAGQTNLLALNATIEAARAGEAGKGFAVVASEVKQLAGQTAQATDQIAHHIKGIQTISKSTADAIGEISKTIDLINEISATISGAVEEQTIATREVSMNIRGVARAAEATGQSSINVLGVAQSLADQATALENRVDRFLDDVREM